MEISTLHRVTVKINVITKHELLKPLFYSMYIVLTM